MPSAAVLIIGNEILTGKFADENGPWLIARLRGLGCDLRRLVVIPDEEATIADEVRRAVAAHDLVITTGGVGPTHDDVTLAGVAAGLGVPVVRHPELEALLRARMGERCNAAALRMADVPEGAALVWEGQRGWPLVVAGSVYVFPGVPVLLREKFEGVAARFAGIPLRTARLRTLRTEPEIADALTEAATRWPMVDMGSYPRFETHPRSVILTLESRDAPALEAALAWLRAAIPDAEAMG
jgi:molybdenum cofactor synthesis domain-containing protein